MNRSRFAAGGLLYALCVRAWLNSREERDLLDEGNAETAWTLYKDRFLKLCKDLKKVLKLYKAELIRANTCFRKGLKDSHLEARVRIWP